MNDYRFKIRRFIEKESAVQWILVILGVLLYGFSIRLSLFEESISYGATLNKWDLVIHVMNNPYLWSFILLWLLWLSLRSTNSEFNYNVLVRMRSYKKWIISTLRLFFLRIILLVGCLVAVMIVLMIGVPSGLGWSDFALIQGEEHSMILAQGINHPLIAIIFHVLLLFLSGVTIHLFLTWIYLFTYKLFIVSVVAISYWVMFIVSFKWFPAEYSISNYWSLSQSYLSFGNLWAVFLVGMIFFIIALGLCETLDMNFKNKKGGRSIMMLLYLYREERNSE
ncbi:hypothetical protein [Shouchella lonarensis]|uniref:ABC-2 family transporter protein n=1 Tax=Shouchella lonarensis TaxID=1464122 RepID=A0A1G6MWP0_9BACI|nr:hypothetical protein [Shouchella lonarensis]SDC59980.1 hypothetical protein SAMN05421737_11124 [Shouchella lonarensis]